jgi:hypothetical protein
MVCNTSLNGAGEGRIAASLNWGEGRDAAVGLA